MKLFAERGWATSVRDIAREAGVAVETVYSVVGSKRELLKVAMDVAIVGDDEPVALDDRRAAELEQHEVGAKAERCDGHRSTVAFAFGADTRAPVATSVSWSLPNEVQ